MSTERRPDPDELLARVKEAETRQARGKLKIFFGAAAGVGKTYAMLEAAREQRTQGVDVVVGWVETHGRVETGEQLAFLQRQHCGEGQGFHFSRPVSAEDFVTLLKARKKFIPQLRAH